MNSPPSTSTVLESTPNVVSVKSREKSLQGPPTERDQTFRTANPNLAALFTQPGARVAELIEEGFHISSCKARPEDRFKTYFLESEPTIRKAVTRYMPKQKRLTDDGGDWYERVTGRKRAIGLPLFDLNAEASR